MAQTELLVSTLKRELKSQGKTYADVAAILDISEASVKRLFSSQQFTLKRLEKICAMLNFEFSELVYRMKKSQQQLSELSWEQEKEIAGDIILLLVTVNIISGLTYQEIIEIYQITAAECTGKLTLLDKLNIIELLPNNRVKLLVSPNFHWLPNGPIQQFFQEKVEQDFFSSRFDKRTEKLIVANALLTDSSNARLQKKMERLLNEFNDLLREDYSIPNDKKHGTTIVLALRQWQYSLFKQLQQKND